MRATLYVGMARGSADERGFETIRRIRLARSELPRLTLAEFKMLVREQFFMLADRPGGGTVRHSGSAAGRR